MVVQKGEQYQERFVGCERRESDSERGREREKRERACGECVWGEGREELRRDKSQTTVLCRWCETCMVRMRGRRQESWVAY